MGLGVPKKCKVYGGWRDLKPLLSACWPRWHPRFCVNHGTNGSAIKSARQGQFHDKKNADYWSEYFPSNKIFSTENNNGLEQEKMEKNDFIKVIKSKLRKSL